jgi:hypothetical protein
MVRRTARRGAGVGAGVGMGSCRATLRASQPQASAAAMQNRPSARIGRHYASWWRHARLRFT